jgi:hypothetical protein
MGTSRPTRTIVDLPRSTDRQLNMYVLAACAAGVSLLALAQPTGARIVYTPAHIRIGPGVTVQLDLNHDGISDFSIWNYDERNTSHDAAEILGATPKNRGNGVVSSGSWAAALPKNVRIGSSRTFVTGSGYMAIVGQDYSRFYGGGPWIGDKAAFLGFKFQIDGETHYGWARLHVNALLIPPVRYPPIDATLTGYAYETIANKAIITGRTKGPDKNGSVEEPNPAALTAPTREPVTLGLLAMGSPSLSVWRRKESLGAPQ